MPADDFGRNAAASIEAPRRFQLRFPFGGNFPSERRPLRLSPNACGRRRCARAFPLTCLSVQSGVQEHAPVWAGLGHTPRSPRSPAPSKTSPSIHENIFFSPPGIRKHP